MNFAVIGVGGYIAPRHLRAIRDTGNAIVAAYDPNDSVGILDQYGFAIRFFTEFERFDRFIDKLRRGDTANRVHYISICSPNYLHDAHCRATLRNGASAICEKPLVINPWNLDPLLELEAETGNSINTILQLRVHPKLVELQKRLTNDRTGQGFDVDLTYITSRGDWYHNSWKGNPEKSGGIAVNIGIHLFDLLVWLFGSVQDCRVYCSDKKRMSGFLQLEYARVRWYLSIDPDDLPTEAKQVMKTTHRSITINGEEIEFSDGFTDLHTRVYERTLAGNGFRISDIRPATELTYRIRTEPIITVDNMAHPLIRSC